MSDSYKLVFRGEVLEGQHPAVVRKRLAAAASFTDAQIDKLFSGHPVVVKREVDAATAARFQGLFRKAGARLRAVPTEAQAPAAEAGPGPQTLELLPPGSDVLRDDERPAEPTREIPTGDLALEKPRFGLPEDDPVPAPAFPDLSHLTLAEVGSTLGLPREHDAGPVAAPAFEVAEPGADLAPRAPATRAPVDFATLAFDVAPVGSDLGAPRGGPSPPFPDVSHLELVRDASQP